MSPLLHEPDGVVQAGVAGWLRFVPTPDGSVVRAALLLISFEPEFKEFSFTQLRIGAEGDPFHRVHPENLREAADSLVRFTRTAPFPAVCPGRRSAARLSGAQLRLPFGGLPPQGDCSWPGPPIRINARLVRSLRVAVGPRKNQPGVRGPSSCWRPYVISPC